MHGYTKLFESILTSTIWDENEQTRIVWITMLALKNQHHVVEASVPGLARMARVSLEATQRALEKFLAPDLHSRSQEFEGRRIQAVDGGWLILNGAKYDSKMKQDERREYMRRYMAEKRERQNGAGPPPPNDGRFQPPSQEDCRAHALAVGLPEAQANAFWHFYESKGWKVGRNPMKSWHSAMAGWKTRFEEQGASGNGARSVGELRTVMSAKELLASQIKDKYSSDGAMGATWSDEAKREEWRKLRGEIKALNEQIAGRA